MLAETVKGQSRQVEESVMMVSLSPHPNKTVKLRTRVKRVYLDNIICSFFTHHLQTVCLRPHQTGNPRSCLVPCPYLLLAGLRPRLTFGHRNPRHRSKLPLIAL